MQESKSMRKRLAEWSKTPEGRVAYEKVAEEMRNEIAITNNPEESEKPMNPDDSMKELDEKIALVKQRGTWDGVDVDKYMDEVRGREPEKPMELDLEIEIEDYVEQRWQFAEDLNAAVPIYLYDMTLNELKDCARYFAKWGAEHLAGVRKMIEPEKKEGRTDCSPQGEVPNDSLATQSYEKNPNDLEEAAEEWEDTHPFSGPSTSFIAGAKWQKLKDEERK